MLTHCHSHAPFVLFQLNVAFPATGAQKLFEVVDEHKLRIFYEKRMGAEVEADLLGDEWKGYVVRVTGGNDKQGFPMKQGILTNGKQTLHSVPYSSSAHNFILWGCSVIWQSKSIDDLSEPSVGFAQCTIDTESCASGRKFCIVCFEEFLLTHILSMHRTCSPTSFQGSFMLPSSP